MAQKKVTKAKASSRETLQEKKKRMLRVLKVLKRLFPNAKCSLTFETPYQLLVATVLSAQCTDERVNKTTPALFARYPGPREMAGAPIGEIEKLVQSTGFYKNKAKSIQELSKALLEKHDGEVPRSMDELTPLRGVGRKTANVVLGNAFGIPGIPVDTHVGRLSRRLGLTREMDPVKVEFDLMELTPKVDWTMLTHYLIYHGRATCSARKPLCDQCEIAKDCPQVGVTV